MLLTTLLFKFDIHIGTILVDVKNNEDISADGSETEKLSESQIELMKSNVFPESYTHLSQGVHSFCFNIGEINSPIYCYTAFLSVQNSQSERSFDQYSFVIATKLPFYPLFLRLLDSINFLVDSSKLSPHEIFILLAEFAAKWGKHLSLITFSKPCLKIDSGSSSGSSSSSDASNSDSSDYTNQFINNVSSVERNLYNALIKDSEKKSDLINYNFEETNSDKSKEPSNIQETNNENKQKSIEAIKLNEEDQKAKSASKDISTIMNLNLCLSTRFELPLFNGVVPVNPHPKLTYLLSTQSYIYCANPYFVGSDLMTDIEDGFDGALMLWEACITDQPIVIIASTPRKATNAVFAVASLTYPEEPPTTVNPYISVTDKRFKILTDKPKGIIGISNPIAENLFRQRAKVVQVGFGGKTTKNLPMQKQNSSAKIEVKIDDHPTNTEKKSDESYGKGYLVGAPSSQNSSNTLYPPSIMYTNQKDGHRIFENKGKSDSYASFTNSPLPRTMTKSPTMVMSLPNRANAKPNALQRSQSARDNIDEFKEMNSAQIRYRLFQNTKRLRKAICEAVDTQISLNIINVLLNNFDLPILIGRLRANNILSSSPYIEFSSFLIKSKMFKHICKERLSTSSAVNKFLSIDVFALNPENAKKICIIMIHVIQDQNLSKEVEKVIKKKLRLIAPIFQTQKQQKENTQFTNADTDKLTNSQNDISPSQLLC